MISLHHDLRYASRRLLHSPGLTIGVTLTLALGIGGASIVFSLLDAVLRPPPWPAPDRTVVIWETDREHGIARSFPSPANYADWRRLNTTFESLAHWRFVYFNASGDNRIASERIQGGRVSAEFLPMLGGSLLLGRGFVRDDEQPGRDRVAVLSYEYWQRRFGGRPDILGSSIRLDGQAVSILGVLSREFQMFRVLNRELDVYLPLVLDPARLSRDDHSINVYGRLRPGITLAQAQSEMDAIARRLEQQFPGTNSGRGVQLLPVTRALSERSRPVLFTLLAAVAILLGIACVNTANLLVARSRARQKEIAVRRAIGGSPSRIIRQLLAESLLLALLAGALGLAAAFFAVRILDARIAYTELQRMNPFRVNGAVFGFTCALSSLTALASGLAPALRAVRMARYTGRHTPRGRLALVSEAALTALLLIASATATKHALHLLNLNRGFDPRGVLSMQLWLSRASFSEQVLTSIRNLPGVETVSVVNYPPAGVLETSVPVAASPRASNQDTPVARYWIASPEYLATIRLPFVRGRFFHATDRQGSPGVAVVSESLARRLYPATDALGATVRPIFPQTNAFWIPHAAEAPLKIVGIVKDVDETGLMADTAPQLYLPYEQNPVRITHLLVRARSNPAALALARAIQAEIARIDPDQPVFDIKPLEQVTAEAFGAQRSVGIVLTIFASLALILATVGVYAVVAHNVAARSRELAIRVAVGALPHHVRGLVLRQALIPVLAGLTLGILAALAANKVVVGVVVNAPVWDTPLSVTVCMLVAAIAAAAAYAPTSRAARVDPMLTLRSE